MIKVGVKVRIIDSSLILTKLDNFTFKAKLVETQEKHPEIPRWNIYNTVRKGREGILIKKLNSYGCIYCLVNCGNKTIITRVKGLEKISRFSPKKKKKEIIKKPKKIKKPDTDVLIDKKLYNQICELRYDFINNDKHFPDCYMLGKDKNNIIKKLISLEGGGGDNCHRMISITATSMTKGIVYLIREKLTPCGILRIGKFDGEPEYERGASLRQLCNKFKNAYIISLGKNNRVVIEQSYKRGRVKNLSYAIV